MYDSQRKKPLPVHDRKDATDYVRAFILYIRKTQGRVFDLRHPGQVKYMVELMNDPKNTTFKSIRDPRDSYYYWHKQRFDYVPSNLGRDRGFVFYFICNGCGRRVKYLYEYSSLESPLCRTCCHLKYEQPSRKARDISRLIRRPYLSSEDKYVLIKRAGITTEDVVAAKNQQPRRKRTGYDGMHGLAPERELVRLPSRLSLVGDVPLNRLPVAALRDRI